MGRLLDLKVCWDPWVTRSYIFVIHNYAMVSWTCQFFMVVLQPFSCLESEWLNWTGSVCRTFCFCPFSVVVDCALKSTLFINVSYLLIVFVIILNICVIFFHPATYLWIAYLSREVFFDVFFSEKWVFVNNAVYWRWGLEGFVKVDWHWVNACRRAGRALEAPPRAADPPLGGTGKSSPPWAPGGNGTDPPAAYISHPNSGRCERRCAWACCSTDTPNGKISNVLSLIFTCILI